MVDSLKDLEFKNLNQEHNELKRELRELERKRDEFKQTKKELQAAYDKNLKYRLSHKYSEEEDDKQKKKTKGQKVMF